MSCVILPCFLCMRHQLCWEVALVLGKDLWHKLKCWCNDVIMASLKYPNTWNTSHRSLELSLDFFFFWLISSSASHSSVYSFLKKEKICNIIVMFGEEIACVSLHQPLLNSPGVCVCTAHFQSVPYFSISVAAKQFSSFHNPLLFCPVTLLFTKLKLQF